MDTNKVFYSILFSKCAVGVWSTVPENHGNTLLGCAALVIEQWSLVTNGLSLQGIEVLALPAEKEEPMIC